MKPMRLVIYPKDIQVITGKSLRSAQRLYREIKAHLGRLPREFVTITEFCDFIKIDREEALKILL